MTGEKPEKHTIYLSRLERRTGGRRFIRFQGFNGLGISFLGDSTVTLLAIYFGAGNTELGMISAMIHISGIVLLAVPRLFRGRNVVTVGFWSWIIRGLVCLPYVFLFHLQGRPAVALLMATYAVFCLSRTAGVAMVTTIQKRLMVSRTQNDLVFRNATTFQGSQILSRIISYSVLSLKHLAELAGLISLGLLGVVFNTAAAFSLRTIPNRTRVDYRPEENLFIIFRNAMRNPKSRRVLFVRWISLAQIILFGMAIPLLRRSVGIDSARIFLFTVALSVASFISSITIRPLASRAGSRPLLFFSTIPAALLFMGWVFMPETLPLFMYSLAGFITIFIHNAYNLAVSRLLIDITPDDGAVGFNSMETFVTSMLALVLGVGAGLLADLSRGLSGPLPINDYGLVFLPAALGAVWQVFLAVKIEDPGSMGLAESMRMITSLSNLKTWKMVSDLESIADPVKRKTIIHSMSHSQAPAATSEIRRILAEPLSQEKGDIIDALFLTRRPELAEYLAGEAADPAAFHRDRAIFALGAYPGELTERVLGALLNDPEPRVRAAAAKSLGRVGAKGHLEKIRDMWNDAKGLHERLDYMIALYHMDPEKRYLDNLFSRRIISAGEKAERTFFTLVSRQFGMIPPLGIIYREEAARYGAGMQLLLDESRDTRFLLDQSVSIEQGWMNMDYGRLWEMCLKTLKDEQPPEELIPVKRALMSYGRTEVTGDSGMTPLSRPADRPAAESQAAAADSANAMAALYFTYQILTAGVET